MFAFVFTCFMFSAAPISADFVRPTLAPCDPEAFLSRLEIPPIPVVIPFTLRDALELELHKRSKTMSRREAHRVANIIYTEAKRHGHSPLLFLSVIYIESYFNHLAISPVGAEGLTQLMPATARKVAADHKVPWQEGDSFKPETNVRLGILYLSELLKQFPRLEVALTAYNRGPGNTQHILAKNKRKLPEHVLKYYAAPVLKRKKLYEQAFSHLPQEAAGTY